MLVSGIYMGSRKIKTRKGVDMEIYDLYDSSLAGLVRVMLPADCLQSKGVSVGDCVIMEARTTSLVFGVADTVKVKK